MVVETGEILFEKRFAKQTAARMYTNRMWQFTQGGASARSYVRDNETGIVYTCRKFKWVPVK